MMKSVPVIALVLSVIAQMALGHLCIFDPPQRGDLGDLTKGSGTCFRPIENGICGGQTSPSKMWDLKSGQEAKIHFQQNLNHYSIGNNGRFQLEYTLKEQPAQGDWKEIAALPDYFAHRELWQTNFTYIWDVPSDLTTDHGILRMKYVSNKPGEPTAFVQCVDFKVGQPMNARRTFKNKLFSVQYNPLTMNFARVVEITAEGRIFPVLQLGGPVQEASTFSTGSEAAIKKHQFNLKFSKVKILNGIVAADQDKGYLYYLVRTDGQEISQPNTVMKVDIAQGTSSFVEIKTSDPISSLMYHPRLGKLLVIQMVTIQGASFHDDEHFWRVSTLNEADGTLDRICDGPKEKLYINYLWDSLSAVDNYETLTLLLRNEHDPFNLTQNAYSINTMKSQTYNSTVLKTDATYNCVHQSQKMKFSEYYAVSPGSPEVFIPQRGQVTNYQAATVNSFDGSVSTVSISGAKGYPYNGGCIKNGMGGTDKLLQFIRLDGQGTPAGPSTHLFEVSFKDGSTNVEYNSEYGNMFNTIRFNP